MNDDTKSALISICAQNKIILDHVNNYTGWYTYLLSNSNYGFCQAIHRILLVANDIYIAYITKKEDKATVINQMTIINFNKRAAYVSHCVNDDVIKNEIYSIRANIVDASSLLSEHVFITEHLFRFYEIILAIF
jgi:hypothetical protein